MSPKWERTSRRRGKSFPFDLSRRSAHVLWCKCWRLDPRACEPPLLGGLAALWFDESCREAKEPPGFSRSCISPGATAPSVDATRRAIITWSRLTAIRFPPSSNPHSQRRSEEATNNLIIFASIDQYIAEVTHQEIGIVTSEKAQCIVVEIHKQKVFKDIVTLEEWLWLWN